MFRAQFPTASPYVPVPQQPLAAHPTLASFLPSFAHGPRVKQASTQWLQQPGMRHPAHDAALAETLQRLHNGPVHPATEVGNTLLCRMQGLAGGANAVLLMQRDHGHADQPTYDLSGVVLEMHQQPGALHPYLAPHAPPDIGQHANLSRHVLASPLFPDGGLIEAGSLTWLHEDLAHMQAGQLHIGRIQPDIDAVLQRIWSGQLARVPMLENGSRIRRYSVAPLPSAPNNVAAAAQLEFHPEPANPHHYHLQHVTIGLPNMPAMRFSNPAQVQPVAAPDQVSEAAGVDAPTCRFQGAEYRMEPLGLNDFAARLRPVQAAPGPRAHSAFAAGFNPAALLSPADKKREAQRHLQHLMGGLLSQHPARLQAVKAATLAGLERFGEADDTRLQHLRTAIANYVSDTGYHVFMNAILEGHEELEDFLRPMGPYRTEDDIEAYCRAFIDEYGEISGYDPQDLKDMFSGDLQLQTQVLREFLEDEGVPLSGITVAHGVATGADRESYSVAVDGEGYMSAFMAGDPILYKSFFSTTAELDTALNFASKSVTLNVDALLTTAIDTVDLKDRTPTGMARRHEYLAHIADDDLDDMALLVIAKGVDGQGHFLWPEITGFANEHEMLLGPDHVLVPQRIIRGADYYALVADIHRLDEESDLSSDVDMNSSSGDSPSASEASMPNA